MGKDGVSPAGVLAVLTPLLAGLGALTATGTLGGIQRNSPTPFIVAIGLVVFAAVLWIMGEFVDSEKRVFRRIGRSRPAVLGVLGLLSGLVLVLETSTVVGRFVGAVLIAIGVMALSIVCLSFGTREPAAADARRSTTSTRDVLEPAAAPTGAPDATDDGPITVRLSPQDLVRILSLACAAGGVVLAVLAAEQAAGAVPRPTIKAQVAQASPVVTGTVKVANLASDDRLTVEVYGVIDPYVTTFASALLTRIIVGPDADGDAEVPLDTRFQPGRFTHIGVRAFTVSALEKGTMACEPENDAKPAPDGPEAVGPVSRKLAPAGAACFIVPVPPAPRRPAIDMSWDEAKRTLDVALEAGNSPRRVALTILTRRKGSTVPMYRAVTGPDTDGHLKQQFDLQPPRGSQLVCAVAEFVRHGQIAPLRTHCPSLRAKPFGLATARMRLPA